MSSYAKPVYHFCKMCGLLFLEVQIYMDNIANKSSLL